MSGNGRLPSAATPVRRILALGGHEFSARPPDRAVCELLLRLASERGGERPRICILPTASGDTSEQIASFYSAFGERHCEPSDVSLFRLGRRPMALRDHLLSQDLIYVGGGSMLNLLAVWEAHDVASILSLAWRRGIVLAGQSAGAMCWFEAGITKSSGKPLAAAGLGLLSGSLCVHYNNEPERRAAYLDAVSDGMPSGYGLDDYAGLLWEGDGTPSALTARRGARLPRHLARGRGARVAAPGPLPPRPRPRRPARGHRRVPPHQDDAQTRRLAGLSPSSVMIPQPKNYILRVSRCNFSSTVAVIMEALEMERPMTEWNDDRLDELNERVKDGFAEVDKRFDKVDERFDKVDERFDKVDERFDKVDERFIRLEGAMKADFKSVDARFAYVCERMDAGFERINDRLDHLYRVLIVAAVGAFATLLANGIWG